VGSAMVVDSWDDVGAVDWRFGREGRRGAVEVLSAAGLLRASFVGAVGLIREVRVLAPI